MPLKIGKRTFSSFADAVRFVKQSKPSVKDSAAYVKSIENIISERRAKKAKALKKK